MNKYLVTSNPALKSTSDVLDYLNNQMSFVKGSLDISNTIGAGLVSIAFYSGHFWAQVKDAGTGSKLRWQDIVDFISSDKDAAIGGAVVGTMVGGTVGGPVGAVVGAVGGAVGLGALASASIII